MLTTKSGGPEGFPWLVMDGERAVAAAPDEAGAVRVAHVLGAWSAAAPRALVTGGARVPYGATRPAAGAWGGADAPVPGRVYELSGLARDGVARDVTPAGPEGLSGLLREGAARAAAAPAPLAAATSSVPAPAPAAPAAEAWTVGEARVVRREVGYAVSFPARPPVHVRTELKASGFRWFPEVGEWRGVRLPVRLLPHRSGSSL